MSGRLKSNSLGSKGAEKMCLPNDLLQQPGCLTTWGKLPAAQAVWMVLGPLASASGFHTPCPELEHGTAPRASPDSGKGRRDGWSSPFSPGRHLHQADAITGFRSAGGGPPEEWGRLSDASEQTRESMSMFSRRAQSHRNEWAWHTHSCSCETLASNMHRSPAMQVKGGYSLPLFYWKIHKEMLHKHYAKRS